MLGIKVQYIPDGCAYLCQPINVGVNRSIKRAMLEQWGDLLETKGFQGTIKTPPHKLITRWVVEAYWTINMETCKNA